MIGRNVAQPSIALTGRGDNCLQPKPVRPRLLIDERFTLCFAFLRYNEFCTLEGFLSIILYDLNLYRGFGLWVGERNSKVMRE